ncbi:MAG: hypothetical protein QME75_13080 [Deltaproteobacteria bacterium]|nr:hypothetical protein [Deltaproteobacteria bacterium]
MTMRSQAAAAEYKAEVEQRQAVAARRMGDIEQQKLREEARALRGRQMALYGKSGVELEGSPLLIMGESAYRAARDVAVARESAQWNARLYEAQGQIYSMGADTLNKGAGFALGGSLLTTGASAFSMAKKTGVLPNY